MKKKICSCTKVQLIFYFQLVLEELSAFIVSYVSLFIEGISKSLFVGLCL